MPVSDLTGTDLKASRVDWDVAQVTVSKTTFLSDCDVDSGCQGHQRAGGNIETQISNIYVVTSAGRLMGIRFAKITTYFHYKPQF